MPDMPRYMAAATLPVKTIVRFEGALSFRPLHNTSLGKENARVKGLIASLLAILFRIILDS